MTKNGYILKFIHTMTTNMLPRYVHRTMHRPYDGFIYVKHGACTYFFESGKRFSVTEGDIIYLSKDAMYDMNVTEEYECIYADFIFEHSSPDGSCVFKIQTIDSVENLFIKLLRSHGSRDIKKNADCMSALYSILAILIAAEEHTYLPSSVKERIGCVKLRMEEEFSNHSLNIGLLAKEANMSEVHLRRIFHSVYSTTPIEYLSDIRMAHAKKLLSGTNMKEEEIAVACGFSSLTYFCRVFNRRVGMTPRTFRINFAF